ncbi:hypothetical protein [Schumannella soli]|uniref:Uncharacterized protein n=1 Tax=Schumannella soli TaxID=2590779 RepID=A0A506YA99_9MICO|nr:hypothetical protein [Schumannella soli]TPW78027.1 hypothetical protein FJ657_05210 [Schumannella soli]
MTSSPRPSLRGAFVVGWIAFAVATVVMLSGLSFVWQSSYWAVEAAVDPNAFADSQRFWALSSAIDPAIKAAMTLAPLLLVALLAGHALRWHRAQVVRPSVSPGGSDVASD